MLTDLLTSLYPIIYIVTGCLMIYGLYKWTNRNKDY